MVLSAELLVAADDVELSEMPSRLLSELYADEALLRSPFSMELNRSKTSVAKVLRVELDELDELDELLESRPIGGAGGGPPARDGACDSKVVTADCAELMSPLDRAVCTLDRNCPSGFDESALDEVSDSTWVRYFSAPLVSPD